MRKVNLGNAGKTLSAVIAVLFAFCLAFMSVFYVRAYAEESLQLVSASGTYYKESRKISKSVRKRRRSRASAAAGSRLPIMRSQTEC